MGSRYLRVMGNIIQAIDRIAKTKNGNIIYCCAESDNSAGSHLEIIGSFIGQFVKHNLDDIKKLPCDFAPHFHIKPSNVVLSADSMPHR